MPYLFVHFREKTTPDGEQVYFGVSKDGFYWEEINHGLPVLWAYYGDKGVRDFTITRCKQTGTFYIFAKLENMGVNFFLFGNQTIFFIGQSKN